MKSFGGRRRGQPVVVFAMSCESWVDGYSVFVDHLVFRAKVEYINCAVIDVDGSQ